MQRDPSVFAWETARDPVHWSGDIQTDSCPHMEQLSQSERATTSLAFNLASCKIAARSLLSALCSLLSKLGQHWI